MPDLFSTRSRNQSLAYLSVHLTAFIEAIASPLSLPLAPNICGTYTDSDEVPDLILATALTIAAEEKVFVHYTQERQDTVTRRRIEETTRDLRLSSFTEGQCVTEMIDEIAYSLKIDCCHSLLPLFFTAWCLCGDRFHRWMGCKSVWLFFCMRDDLVNVSRHHLHQSE